MELTNQNADTFLSMCWGLWREQPAPPGWVSERTGWLDLPKTARSDLSEVEKQAARWAKDAETVVVMGMGGSSLCPLMWSRYARPSGPRLVVLDTTDPERIRRAAREMTVSRSAFLASSKSGTTAETRALLDFFIGKAGKGKDPKRFAVLSDPGTELRAMAQREKFASMPATPKTVGGRFSALTPFGMIPACVAGLDVNRLLSSADRMRERCLDAGNLSSNPGWLLGRWLAEREESGQDKLTLILSPGLEPFGLWLEQLLAESLGKNGRGLLPVLDDVTDSDCSPGKDRCYAGLFWSEDPKASERWSKVPPGAPRVGPFFVESPEALGSEIYRWEFATAMAGALIGINPFDQPNVEAAKAYTRAIVQELAAGKPLPYPDKLGTAGRVTLRGSGASGRRSKNGAHLRDFFAQAGEGTFVPVLAYLPESDETDAFLSRLKSALRGTLPHAVTLGYGPRYLHSTGQLHKGGKNDGLFLFLARKLPPKAKRLPIPGRKGLSFDELQLAQAVGDFMALESHGRSAFWLEMDDLKASSMDSLEELVRSALSSL